MPYEISFVKAVTPPSEPDYINECCFGGDVVSERLLPAIKNRYPAIDDAGQEDWGWYIWLHDGDVQLAVDIACDDPQTGAFRIHLTSRKKRWLGSKIVDAPQLDELKALVEAELAAWTGAPVRTERIDRD
jgi:hypothetical protein